MSAARLAWFVLSLIAAFAATPAAGQEYPTRPVRVVIPFPPGGSTDLLARVLAQKLTDSLGRSFVIESRPGGNTIIAAELVAKAPPDGYTLLITVSSTMTMNRSLYAKLPYDPIRDFVPIIMIGQQTLLVAAHPKTPFSSMKGFVDYARANPGKVRAGSGALISRLFLEQMKLTTGVDVTVVPYSGSGPTRQAIIAGDIEVAVGDTGSFAQTHKERRMHGFAITGPNRDRALTEIPTIAEAGFPDLEITTWNGLLSPAGTPAPVNARLNAAFSAALQMPDVKARMADLGFEEVPASPEYLAGRIRSESERWDKVIKAIGLKID